MNQRYHVRLDKDVEQRVLRTIRDPAYVYGFPPGALSALVNKALRALLRNPRPKAVK
jgi:hypothetical protein